MTFTPMLLPELQQPLLLQLPVTHMIYLPQEASYI